MAAVWNFIRSLHWAAQLAILAFVVWVIYALYTWASDKIGGGAKETDVDWSKIPFVGNGDDGEPEQWDPSELSATLYNEMKGINYATAANDPRWKPWSRLASLQSDEQVKAVYNHFNNNYGGGDSLTEWIRSEWPSSISRSSRRDALDRLNKIGLT